MKVLMSLIAAALLAMFALTPAQAAADWTPYSAKALAAAQDAGKTVLVDVFADWCPTCRVQAPILEELAADKRLDDVALIRVNFDTDKAFLRAHRIPRQSTILVFKGHKEVVRSIAETDRARLRSLVLDAI